VIVNKTITLPAPFALQQEVRDDSHRFKVLDCGRRWGKTVIGNDVAIRTMLNKQRVAWVAPTYKMLSPSYQDMYNICRPIISPTPFSNSFGSKLSLSNLGYTDFWSLENIFTMRGREYDMVIIDEAAHFKGLEDAWENVIKPTLLITRGSATFLSTPNGLNYFWKLFNNEKTNDEWKSWKFTTYTNPLIKPEELDQEKLNMTSRRFEQEYMAEFIADGGTKVDPEYLQHFEPYNMNFEKHTFYVGVDLAISQKDDADKTVIAVISKCPEGFIYVHEILAENYTFNQTLNEVINIYNKYKPNVIAMEQNGYQQAAVQELIRTTNLPIKGVTSTKSKEVRFESLNVKYENKQVFHNRFLNPLYEQELLIFPQGKHDDTVDAVVHAYNNIEVPRTYARLA
jgi:predicted phage terminase large subunit-like protein